MFSLIICPSRYCPLLKNLRKVFCVPVLCQNWFVLFVNNFILSYFFFISTVQKPQSHLCTLLFFICIITYTPLICSSQFFFLMFRFINVLRNGFCIMTYLYRIPYLHLFIYIYCFLVSFYRL